MHLELQRFRQLPVQGISHIHEARDECSQREMPLLRMSVYCVHCVTKLLAVSPWAKCGHLRWIDGEHEAAMLL